MSHGSHERQSFHWKKGDRKLLFCHNSDTLSAMHIEVPKAWFLYFPSFVTGTCCDFKKTCFCTRKIIEMMKIVGQIKQNWDSEVWMFEKAIMLDFPLTVSVRSQSSWVESSRFLTTDFKSNFDDLTQSSRFQVVFGQFLPSFANISAKLRIFSSDFNIHFLSNTFYTSNCQKYGKWRYSMNIKYFCYFKVLVL